MSMKNTNARVLWNDLKISFKFALKNIISFILGMIGVLIVTGLIIALIAVVIIVPLIFSGGLFVFIDTIMVWVTTAQTLPGAVAFLMILLLITPIFAPILVALGALFGMGREIVESEGTTAEGVFAWYSKKFLSLAGAGIVQFLVLIAPLAAMIVLIGPVNLGISDLGLAAIGLSGIMIYFAIVSGFLSLTFPAVIDGKSVVESIKTSLRLSTRYFDRVFSVWLAFLGIALITLVPIMAPAMLVGPSIISGDVIGLAGYGSLMALFDALVLLPAMVIGMSRIYMILVSEDMAEPGGMEQGSYDDVSLIGGD